MILEAGTRLEQFRITSLLGRGGMADVYRAEEDRLGRNVALKVLPAEFARDKERVARFDREVRSAAGLAHPNIVPHPVPLPPPAEVEEPESPEPESL